MALNACRHREQLSDYLLGKLDEAQAASVDTHLAHCQACREDMEYVSQTEDELVQCIKRGAGEGEFDREPALQRVLTQLQHLRPPPFAGFSDGETERAAEWATEVHPGRLGQYRLIKQLGSGGMGSVFLAEHTRLEMTVAIKLLARHLINDPQAIARFNREMKAVGKIQHPNIVRATDAGEDDGRHFLAMEYVEGCDLNQVLRSRRRLQVNDACEVIRQAALGIHHAHELGLIHRDLKPSNLMVNTEGQVKVLDLGLARVHKDHRGPGLTDDFQVMGTADYMSPEQALSGWDIDERTDIYSLGCTLYALLCGRPPFGDAKHRAPLRKLMAHDQESPVPVIERRDDVPNALSQVVDRALAKSPQARFASAADFAHALTPYVAGANLAALASLPHGAQFSTTEVTSDISRHIPLIDTATTPFMPSPSELESAGTQRQRRVAVAGLGGLLLLASLIWMARPEPHRIQVDPSASTRPIPTTLDVTRWALERGASVHVSSLDRGFLVREPAELPEAAFEITGIEFAGQFVPTSDEFTMLSQLEHLILLEFHDVLLDEALVQQLLRLPNLHELKLRYHAIRPHDLELLHRLPAIRHLTIGGSQVGDETLIPIGRLRQVVGLTIAGNQVTDDGLTALAEMKQVDFLSLVFTQVTGSGLKSLRGLPRLGGLHLAYTPVNDAGLAELATFPHLIWLNLVRTRISNDALKSIALLPKLEILELDETAVSDDGIRLLREMRTLRSLSLAKTLITDGVSEDLAAMDQLKTLNVGDRLSMAAITDLKRNLPACTLRFIPSPLGATSPIGMQATVERTVATEMIKRGATLYYEVNEQFFPASQVEDLPRRSFLVSRIVFPAGIELTDEEFGSLARLKQLGALELSDVFLTDRVVNHLSRIPRLQMLTLRYASAPDGGLAGLARLPGIYDLQLRGRGVGDADLDVVTRMPGIGALTLEGRNFTDRTLVRIGGLTQLKWLALAGTGVTNEGIPHLDALTRLESLHLVAAKVDDRGIQRLRPSSSLTRLNLADTQITDQSLPHLAQFITLQELILHDTSIGNAKLSVLENLPLLQSLDVRHTQITDDAIEALTRLSRLKTLRIGDRLSATALQDLRLRLPQCHVDTTP